MISFLRSRVNVSSLLESAFYKLYFGMSYYMMDDIRNYKYIQPSLEDYLIGDPNAQDGDDQTLLHKYIFNRDFKVEIMQSIINRGARLELRDKKGRTALLLAVLNRKKNAMEVLIEKGANVHVKDKDENNALHCMADARLNCHFESVEDFNFDDTYHILERLLKEGVDVNAQNRNYEDTPLMYAARGEHLEIVKMLLAFGANVHLRNVYLETCLHFAANDHHWEYLDTPKIEENTNAILSELVRNKACVNCFNSNFKSPLHYALENIFRKCPNLAKGLIKNSALLYWYKKIEFHSTASEYLEDTFFSSLLVRYADLHYEEIEKMKRHMLPGKSAEEQNEMEKRILPRGSNLCEYAREGVTEDDMRQTPGIKDEVFKIILTESFPLYLDLILSKLGRRFLLEKGRSLSIFTIIEKEVVSLNSDTMRVTEVVRLNSDIVYEICCILKDIDIFNLLSAFPDQFS